MTERITFPTFGSFIDDTEENPVSNIEVFLTDVDTKQTKKTRKKNSTGNPVKRVAVAYPAFYDDVCESFGVEVAVIKTPEEVKNYDLIVFTGGADIDPELYGEPNTHSMVDHRRDSIEVPIAKEAISLGKKILGLCRGHQLINVLLGGTLLQELALSGASHPSSHSLSFVYPGIIYNFYGKTSDKKPVNSLHHQCVNYRGKGLTVSCNYWDVAEATENNHIITTQFHPEFMHNDSRSKELFKFLLTEW